MVLCEPLTQGLVSLAGPSINAHTFPETGMAAAWGSIASEQEGAVE